MRSIVNAGVGIEVTSSSQLSWYTSVITDLSTISTSFEQVLGLSYWDILHVNGGAVFEIDDFMITGGLGYAFALNGDRSQLATQGGITSDDTENSSIQWSRLRALVGLTYAP